MKHPIFVLIFALFFLVSVVSAQYVDPSIEQEFDDSGMVSIVVMLDEGFDGNVIDDEQIETADSNLDADSQNAQTEKSAEQTPINENSQLGENLEDEDAFYNGDVRKENAEGNVSDVTGTKTDVDAQYDTAQPNAAWINDRPNDSRPNETITNAFDTNNANDDLIADISTDDNFADDTSKIGEGQADDAGKTRDTKITKPASLQTISKNNDIEHKNIKFNTIEYKNEQERKESIQEAQHELIESLQASKFPKARSFLQIKKDSGFIIDHSFSTIPGVVMRVDKATFENLKNNGLVAGIYAPRKVQALLSDTKIHINASATWSQYYNLTNITGKHQSVCVIDTGVDYTHPGMGGCSATSNINDKSCAKVPGGYDFSNNDANPIDDNGHGTHVAGIVASTDTTYRGVAPDARIIAMKMLDSDGGGFDADLIAAIDWCVYNASIFNISVITMSLGGEIHYSSHCDDNANETPIVASIEAAIRKNITVVAAAGNSGQSNGIVSPACIKNVTAVSWADKTNVINSSADRNNLTDLVAPGTSIGSLKATTADPGCSDISATITSCSGSSMAAPQVAGAVALLQNYAKFAEDRMMQANETQYVLNRTGKIIVDSGGSNLPFSRINIFGALQYLDTKNPRLSLFSPQNNSVRRNGTLILRMNSSETLKGVIVEINNTNFSFSEIYQIWNVNVTSLRNGSYTFRIHGNDSFGNQNSTPLYTILVDSIPPTSGPMQINNSNARNQDDLRINITFNDTTALSYFIFSWNLTGNFTNSTNGTLSGQQNTILVNKSVNGSRGRVVGIQFFANDSAGNWNESGMFNFTIANSLPIVTNLALNSSDILNRSNGTLQAYFGISDTDSDSVSAYETRWYKNSVEQSALRNLTNISVQNLTKNERWNFSVRLFDGIEYGLFSNISIQINNAIPHLNLSATTYSVNETRILNITVNATDTDGDNLNITMNDSLFIKDRVYFTWAPNLSQQGTHIFNITSNDSQDIDSRLVTVIVNDMRDLDNDNNPDYNDTDDDNDGILDGNDFVSGNLSHVNSTLVLNISINSTSNFSRPFNGTFLVNITNRTNPLVQFEFTFNATNNFDFGSITINKTNNGSSAISIRGVDLSATNVTKTIFMDKRNSTVRSVCIKDTEASFENISSACNEADETLLDCNNQTSGAYLCLDVGAQYIISGLSHSALKEQCRDADGDGYGVGCLLGSDCDDSDASKTTTCSSGSSGGGGGGGGGSGGGGGGGGGGGIQNINDTKVQYFPILKKDVTANITVHKNRIALQQLFFTPNQDMEKITVTISRMNASQIDFENESVPYQFFNITSDKMKDSQMDNARIVFALTDSWLKRNNVTNEDIKLQSLINNKWEMIDSKFVVSNGSHSFFESKSSLGTYAISAPLAAKPDDWQALEKTNAPQETPKQGLVIEEIARENILFERKKWILVAILILSIVAMIWFANHKKIQHTLRQKKHSNKERRN